MAARVSKYGIGFDEALWGLPLATLNQIILWDELSNGRKPRWATDGEQGANSIDSLLADALTGGT